MNLIDYIFHSAYWELAQYTTEDFKKRLSTSDYDGLSLMEKKLKHDTVKEQWITEFYYLFRDAINRIKGNEKYDGQMMMDTFAFFADVKHHLNYYNDEWYAERYKNMMSDCDPKKFMDDVFGVEINDECMANIHNIIWEELMHE